MSAAGLLEIKFDADFSIVKAAEAAVADPKQTSISKGDWIVEGFAATQDLDLQGDEIEAGAIKGAASDLLKNSTVLFNHDEERPVAKTLASEPRDAGLWIQVRISKSEPKLWTLVQEGVINKFSIRGRIVEAFKKWDDATKSYIRVIKKMTLVEVSLVSVPANPEARTLRWYVAKALSEFQKNGGLLPGGREMEIPMTTAVTTTTETPAASTPPIAKNEPAMTELTFQLDDAEKLQLTKAASMVGSLFATEQDVAKKAELQVLLDLSKALMAGKWSAPSVGIFAMKSAGSVAKKAIIASIVGMAESMSSEEKDAERKKSYGSIVEAFKLPVGSPTQESFEQSLARYEANSDAKIKGAINVARNFLKSGESGLAGKLEQFKSDATTLLKELQAISGSPAPPTTPPPATEKAAPPMGGEDMMAPSADGKCPPGYELKDGMCCRVSGQAAYSAPPAAPGTEKAASATPPAPPAPLTADAITAALAKALEPITERISKIEKSTPGMSKALKGQENAEGGSKKPEDSKIGDVFRGAANGAFARAGIVPGKKS